MSDREQTHLTVSLYGAPVIRLSGEEDRTVTGARNIGLIALLATAPDMRRSRAFLVDTLWSDSTPERGRANLRQLLHALRQTLGAQFQETFDIARDSIALRADHVHLTGQHGDGVFLEGIDLAQEGFEDWLRTQRCDQPDDAGSRVVDDDRPLSFLPRIMVVPFAELSETAPSGVGDALAHDLTSHFARSQLMDALSHFSARSSGAEDAPEPLADYALTGQCRLVGDALTVDATLVDLSDNRVLWSDRQKTSLRSFLTGEDDLTGQMAGQTLRIVMSRSIASSSSTPLPELAAHTLMMSAVALMHSFEKRHFHQAQGQLEEVVARCPEHSVPRAWLAQWHLLRIYQKWSDDPARDEKLAQNAIRNALDLNAACPLSLAIDGNIHTILRTDFDTARQRFSAARAVNPSSAFISQLAAVLETFRGNGAAAVALTDRAFMLSPRDPRRPFFQTLSAGSYVAGGRYEEAVEMAEASLRHNPFHLSAHRCRVIGLQLAGRESEARNAAKELMRIDPSLRVSEYQRTHPAAQTEIIQTWAGALKQAGVPVN